MNDEEMYLLSILPGIIPAAVASKYLENKRTKDSTLPYRWGYFTSIQQLTVPMTMCVYHTVKIFTGDLVENVSALVVYVMLFFVMCAVTYGVVARKKIGWIALLVLSALGILLGNPAGGVVYIVINTVYCKNRWKELN